jgi:spore coat protein H
MTVDEAELETLYDDVWLRLKIPGTLTVDGEDYPTKVRLHGGSSREYPKSSFRFDLGLPGPEGGDIALPDTHDHLILRAEWNDKSMLRNYLGLEIFRNATWIPTPNAEMVHFRINKRYYGVMWYVERIGGDFLRIRGLNNDGSMYEADPGKDCWDPGGDLNPVDDLETYQCIYDHKKGDIEYNDLIHFIEVTLQVPDSEFEATIAKALDVDEYLVYLATMAIIQSQDHIKKNYYLYRDPEGDDRRWIVFPWDLEITLGHLWTEENEVLDETIFYQGNLPMGICPGFCNQLITRLMETPNYEERFWEFVYYILETTFTREFVDQRLDRMVCLGTPDLLADQRMRAENDEYLDRVDEIKDFVDKRRDFIYSL